MPEVVWLKEKRRLALLVQRNAFYSLVQYSENGHDYVVAVENDDYEEWSEWVNDIESDD